MAYTKQQIDRFKCAHCGKRFKTYPKPGQDGLPDEVPFIRGGIVSQRNVRTGKLIHYHGFVGDEKGCFEKAMKKADHPTPDLEDEENWGVGPHEEHH